MTAVTIAQKFKIEYARPFYPGAFSPTVIFIMGDLYHFFNKNICGTYIIGNNAKMI